MEWRLESFRPVRAATDTEAARIFAQRLARRLYGARGRVRLVQHAGGHPHGFDVYVSGARAGAHAYMELGK